MEMATQLEASTNVIGDCATNKDLEHKIPPGECVLDKEGNIVSYPSYKTPTTEKYGQESSIPRLAKVAALGQPIPTAGGWAIDNMKVDPQKDLQIPPECYLYDEDRPWVLGKLNPEALGVPEPADPVPLSQKTLDFFEALDNNYYAEMAEMRKQAEASFAGEERTVASGDVTTAKQAVEEKTDDALKTSKKPKSRNASVSPAIASARRPSTGRSSTSPSTRVPLTGRSKTPNPKSPGRGVSPQPKMIPSSGPKKKVVNAKVDLEIVEKKS